MPLSSTLLSELPSWTYFTGTGRLQTLLSALLLSALFLLYTSSSVFHAVFFLILIYALCYPLLILLQLDFLAATLVILYVGAVCVLFLFILLTVDAAEWEDTVAPTQGYLTGGTHTPLAAYTRVGSFVLWLGASFRLTGPFLHARLPHALVEVQAPDWRYLPYQHSNIETLGSLLYTFCTVELCAFAILLLVAMLGSSALFDVLDRHHA